MAIPEEEEFSLWKEPKVRDAFIHITVGIFASFIVAIPVLTWDYPDEFNWIQTFLINLLYISCIANVLLFIRFLLVRRKAVSDPRPWKIRYYYDKKLLD